VTIDVRPGYLVLDKLALGSLSFDDIYIGPHGVFDSDQQAQDWKLGAHVTVSKVGPLHFTLAGGYMHDSINGGGAYGLLETSFRF
jgi:hypothetical protein